MIRMSDRGAIKPVVQLACPRCNTTVTVDDAYCVRCGTNLDALPYEARVLPVSGLTCPHCGNFDAEPWDFCVSCGMPRGW